MASRIAKNAAWLTFGEIAGRLLRVTLIVYSARVMGAAQWGISSYVLSWSVLFTITSDLGLSSIITRQLVHDEKNRAKYLSTFLFVKLGLVAVGIAAILLVIPSISALPLSQSIAWSLAALVLCDSIRTITSVVNRAREKMHIEAMVMIITQVVIVAIGFVMLRIAPTAESLNIAYAAGSAIGMLVGIFFVRDWLGGIFTSFSRPLVRELLKDSLPIAAIGLLGSMMLNTDIIMLGWMRTPEEIGYYSAAQKIIFTLYVLPTLVAWSLFPAMARLTQDAGAFRKLFEKAMKNVLLIALPITVGGIITAPHIIKLFYGDVYLPATAPFVILLLTIPITYALGVINNVLVAHNKQKYFFAYALMGFVLNAVFNLALIPLWGIAGAAAATLITETVSALYIWRAMKKVGDFRLVAGLGKGCAATVILGIVAYATTAIGTPLAITTILAITTYAGSLWILSEPSLTELTKTQK